MDLLLPYSYIATHRLKQFTIALDEVCMRIMHSTGEHYYHHLDKMSVTLYDNPFEKNLLTKKKSKANALSSDIKTDTAQLAGLYDNILYHGAAVTYEQQKAAIHPYLFTMDSKTYQDNTDLLKKLCARSGYQNGVIDPDIFCKNQNIHPNIIGSDQLDAVMQGRAAYLEREKQSHDQFGRHIIIAANWTQTHLYPQTKREYNDVNNVRKNIFLADFFTQNIHSALQTPVTPHAAKSPYAQERVLLWETLNQVKSRISPDAPAAP